MSLTAHEPTAGIFLLSDHLDAALALCALLKVRKRASNVWRALGSASRKV